MTSVTQRIKDITKPRGGYVKLSEFDCIEINDNAELFDEENISKKLLNDFKKLPDSNKAEQLRFI